MNADERARMAQAAKSMLHSIERDLFGVHGESASTCCGDTPVPLTTEALLENIAMMRAMLPVVYYRVCESLPSEMYGRSILCSARSFGNDQYFMVRPDRLPDFRRAFSPAKFVEYTPELAIKQIKSEYLSTMTQWAAEYKTAWVMYER
jgi:hypothetical protein